MRIKGKLERLDRHGLSGWVVLLNDPTENVDLEVVLDGEVLGRCRASGYRRDVEAAGWGDGQCGFHFAFPPEITEEGVGRARVRFVGTELYLETPIEASRTRAPDPKKVRVRSAAGASPVFIVGSPRSGTSILVAALLAAGYGGFHEGNLLGLIKPLFDHIKRHFEFLGTDNTATLIAHVKSDELCNGIMETFRTLVEGLNESEPWVDKTGNPEMIYGLPHLVEAWPTCRIIFAKRRGIENIVSRLRKFPNHDFRYHCQDWVRNMAAWRETRPLLGAGRSLEVDQYDLITRPGGVAREISELLGLTAPQTLELERAFRRDRPQETTSGTAERVFSLDETGWSPAQIASFKEYCSAEMENFGYSLAQNYRVGTPAPARDPDNLALGRRQK